VTQRLNGHGGSDYVIDMQWVDAVDNKFVTDKENLESQLSVARAALDKEAIWSGLMALGNLLYDRGDTAEALRQFLRARDHSSSPHQMLEMCRGVVRCAMDTSNWLHVATYTQKAESLLSKAKNEEQNGLRVVIGKLKAASGLAHLAANKYAQAAHAFSLVTPPTSTDQVSDLVYPGDAATYGTLCALAQYDRSKLASAIIDNPHFRELLRFAPPEIKSLSRNFYSARFNKVFESLRHVRPLLEADQHLAPHLDTLYSGIRATAMAQFTLPYGTLELASMASVFETDVESLEEELTELIGKKAIQARIDRRAGALVAETKNSRIETYKQTMKVAESHIRTAKSILLRSTLVSHGLVQRPSSVEPPGPPEVVTLDPWKLSAPGLTDYFDGLAALNSQKSQEEGSESMGVTE
jgi:COP9 signalosome complex subunit 1